MLTTSFRTGFAYEAEARRRVAHARNKLAKADDLYVEYPNPFNRMIRTDAQEAVLDALALAEEFEVWAA